MSGSHNFVKQSDANWPWALGGGCGRGQRSEESRVTLKAWASWEDFEGWLGAWAEARLVLGGGGPGMGAMGEG